MRQRAINFIGGNVVQSLSFAMRACSNLITQTLLSSLGPHASCNSPASNCPALSTCRCLAHTSTQGILRSGGRSRQTARCVRSSSSQDVCCLNCEIKILMYVHIFLNLIYPSSKTYPSLRICGHRRMGRQGRHFPVHPGLGHRSQPRS